MATIKKSNVPRGFKANAERLSVKYRQELGVNESEPLSAFGLADYLKIKVYTPEDIGMDLQDVQNLLGNAERDSGWSALTMNTKAGNRIIIHNNSHAITRQQSNLMHEIAHVICDHKQTSNYEGINIPIYMREYNPGQEEEATILSSALMIPRDGLLALLRKKWTHRQIGTYYSASDEMVQLRVNATGVMRQLGKR